MLLFSALLIGLVCILLVVVILAQNSKGGGLATGMSSATQMVGTRRATDWIEKATWVLSGLLLVLSLGLNAYVMSGESENQSIDEIPQMEAPAPSTPDPSEEAPSDGGDSEELPLEDSSPEE